jgi:hypothetical protein
MDAEPKEENLLRQDPPAQEMTHTSGTAPAQNGHGSGGPDGAGNRSYSNMGPDLQSLREVKTRTDLRVQDLMSQLHREKQMHEEDYGRRIGKLRSDGNLKGDALRAQIDRLTGEKAAEDRLFAERIQQAHAEQTEQEHAYNERLAHIEQLERQRFEDLKQKIEWLNQEWNQREGEFLHRIEQLRQEMLEGRRAHQERITRMLEDGQYREEPARLRLDLQTEWKSVEHRIGDQLNLIGDEKAQQVHLYQLSVSRLQQELGRLEGEISEAISHLEKEKAVHLKMIGFRMERLLEEKNQQDRLYEMAQEKERLKREQGQNGTAS